MEAAPTAARHGDAFRVAALRHEEGGGAGRVLDLAVADKVVIGELPGAAVAVAAAIVGMDDHAAGGEEGLAQRVPFVGVVPGRPAVDDDHPGAVVLLGTEEQGRHVGDPVETAIRDVLPDPEAMVAQVVGKVLDELGGGAGREVDAEERLGDARATEHHECLVAAGQERRRVVVAATCRDVADRL